MTRLRSVVYVLATVAGALALASPLYHTESGRFAWLELLNTTTRITFVTAALYLLLPLALWVVRAKKGYEYSGRLFDTVLVAAGIVTMWWSLQYLVRFSGETPSFVPSQFETGWQVLAVTTVLGGFFFATGLALKMVSWTGILRLSGKWTVVASALLLPVVVMPSNFF